MNFAVLYYLDSVYEKIERVDLPDGSNPQILLDNESDLRSLMIYQKRPGEMRDSSKCTAFVCLGHALRKSNIAILPNFSTP